MEVVVSVGILIILANVAIEIALFSSLANQKTTALRLAQEGIEELKGQSWSELLGKVGGESKRILLEDKSIYEETVRLVYYQGKEEIIQATVILVVKSDPGLKSLTEKNELQLITLITEDSCGEKL